MKRMTALSGVIALVLATAAVTRAQEHHVKATLVPVEGSSVTGMVQIEQMPHGGTNIHVVARGLEPGETYVSLYYDNDVCALEPYSADDVIGTYTGNASGVGTTHGKLGDDLDEINSVSVRLASDFTLLACAQIHP